MAQVVTIEQYRCDAYMTYLAIASTILSKSSHFIADM